MVTRLSNYEVLEGWLDYLQDKVAALVGTSKDQILESVRRQNLLQREQFYCLECPLQGEPSMDFALQYQTKDFLGTRDFTGNNSFRYARFFNLYGQMVGPDKKFYLEFETIKGVGMAAAVFLDIHNVDAERVIQRTLAFQAEARRMPRILEIIEIAKKYELVPSNIGFIYSHLNGPLRLTFAIQLEVLLLPDRYDPYAYFALELGMGKQSETLQKAFAKNPDQFRMFVGNTVLMQDLVELSNFDFLDCYLDIDIMPDGSIGDIMGIEVVLGVQSIEGQHEMLHSKEFAEFIFFLQKINVIDERIVCFADCIFYANLPQTLDSQEVLVSMLSHFKLRYKQGKRLPAKVYLQGNRSYEI